MSYIQVGEYAKFKNGRIAKVVNIEEDFIYFDDEVYRQYGTRIYSIEKPFLEFIVNHSKNIIDLIQAGDFVNGEQVIGICECQYDGEKIIYVGGVGIPPKKIYDNQIKSILTKEQYQANCYVVESEE